MSARPFVYAPYIDGGQSAESGLTADRGAAILVASDPVGQAALRPDHVMGVGGASRTLLTLTPRLAVAAALDLGTGCGIGAVLLAEHSTIVVASDISARALAASAATCRASGVPPSRVVWVRSSFADAFADRSFDLVAANPPFVIGPRRHHEYRDTPLAGDALNPLLIDQTRRVLRPGGWGVLVTSWLHRAEQSWEDRVRDWLPADCAAWVAQRDVLPVPEYVDFWLRDSRQASDEALRSRWLANLAALEAQAIGFGWIVLHRALTGPASPPQWTEDVASASRVPSGQEVVDEFARRLADESALRLLGGRVRLAPGAEVLGFTGGAAGAVSNPEQTALIVNPNGWRGPEPLDPALSWLFRSGRDVALQDQLERCSQDLAIDASDVLVSWLVGVRGLIERGFVTLDPS